MDRLDKLPEPLDLVPDIGMLYASSMVRTPLPMEKWLNCAGDIALSLSLAIVLRWLLN